MSEKSRVSRVLFDPPDHEENLRFVRREMEKAKREAEDRWNFDFENEKPKSGRFEWHTSSEPLGLDAAGPQEQPQQPRLSIVPIAAAATTASSQQVDDPAAAVTTTTTASAAVGAVPESAAAERPPSKQRRLTVVSEVQPPKSDDSLSNNTCSSNPASSITNPRDKNATNSSSNDSRQLRDHTPPPSLQMAPQPPLRPQKHRDVVPHPSSVAINQQPRDSTAVTNSTIKAADCDKKDDANAAPSLRENKSTTASRLSALAPNKSTLSSPSSSTTSKKMEQSSTVASGSKQRSRLKQTQLTGHFTQRKRSKSKVKQQERKSDSEQEYELTKEPQLP